MGQCLNVIDHSPVAQDLLNRLIKHPHLPVEVGLHYPPRLLRVAGWFYHPTYPARHAVFAHAPHEDLWGQAMMEPSDMHIPCLPE
ncbi:MAG: hypothetical protein ACK55I_34140, partial [bacterium]